MEKQNDYTLFLLIAAGLGIYWFIRKNKVVPPATTNPSDNPVSTQPVMESGYNVSYKINGLRKFGNVPNTI